MQGVLPPGNDVGVKIPATAQDSARRIVETEAEKALSSMEDRPE